MAMEHVQAVPRRISGDNVNCFGCVEPDDILESYCLVRHDRSSPANPRDDLEVNQMDVDGMRPPSTAILELPDFDGPPLWLGEDTLGDIGPHNAVNLPPAVIVFKSEAPINGSFRWWEGNVAQLCRQITITVLTRD